MSTRVVIGSTSEKMMRQLSQFLIQNGLTVVGESISGHDVLRRVHTVYPDIVVVDYRLKGMDGHQLAEILVSEKVCPVVALISSAEVSHFINLSQEPTFVPLVKPCSRDTLINTINLLVKTSKSIGALEQEIKTIKSDKDKKGLIDKAKRLLIENMNLTEEEAHRRIQKQSMDKGIAKVKIAEAIILMYE